MAHSHVRNPADRKRPRKTGDSSSDEASVPTSDSDYIFIDGVEEEDEVEVEEMPLPPPPPAAVGKKTSARKKKDAKTKRIWKILEEENEKWIDEHEWDPPEPENLPMVETFDPSPDVVLPLLRFQKEWLPWALKQENSVVKGGILADEMGMGKTIQAISLVLTARSLRSPSIDTPSSMESSSSSLPRTRAALVICPVVTLIHWVWEIERYTKRGSTRVLVYHGPKRNTIVYDFKNYDFVLTTYQTVEGDYRKYIMPPKELCEYCGKMIYRKKVKLHLQYYCVPNAKKIDAQAKKEKKKVLWFRSKEEHSFGSEDENGEGKKKVVWKKKKVDEPTDNSVDGSLVKSLLHSVKWERIILDEAHFIRHRCSNTARAVFALDSLYKWALSGTPLQNRVGELHSLVRFLQVYPYACYFCRDCDCNIFDYTTTGECVNCPHANVRHFCWWNRYINTPIQINECRRAMILLEDRLLKSIVLRRTKKGRVADLALPPRIVSLRQDSLDKNEHEFYEALYAQSRVKFDAYARDARTLSDNYANIFDLLTRLRQAVDHPYLVVYSKTAEVPNGGKEDNGDCAICHDPAEDVVVTSCDHVFCKACLIDYSATLGNVSCPSCSKPLTVDLTTNNISGEKNSAIAIKGYKRSGILKRLKIADFKTSTKIDALREEIRYMVEGDGSAKGIVFSQFTSFLDLINFSLQMSGIKCVQLEGSMSLTEIEKAINTFTEDGDCRIFLMSLKAGVALNLTAASHVFLMDSWWNPAVERQAQDRIHRIGQYKPIRTVRFVIEDTIEARILKLQEKKELVFKGTVGDSKDALAKLTEEDFRFLFQI